MSLPVEIRMTEDLSIAINHPLKRVAKIFPGLPWKKGYIKQVDTISSPGYIISIIDRPDRQPVTYLLDHAMDAQQRQSVSMFGDLDEMLGKECEEDCSTCDGKLTCENSTYEEPVKVKKSRRDRKSVV
jgi:hypothetical protein